MNPRHAIAALTLLTAVVFNASAATHYVDLNSPSPTPPYTNWLTAATNIQDAIDAAVAGDAVLVTNGVYATGGRVLYGAMTNRVVITNGINLLSLNGPQVTTISGGPQMRCIYLGSNAVVSGFTLTNGQTRTSSGDNIHERSGGGVWCESGSSTLSNCVLVANVAGSGGGGGGAYQGTFNNCLIASNSAPFGSGGGAYLTSLNGCVVVGNWSLQASGGGAAYSDATSCVFSNNSASYGGGVFAGFVRNSLISSNRANANGGGANGSALFNCLIANNSAQTGGGASSGTLNNCTIIGNTATGSGGGVWGNGNWTNCILYYNAAPSGSNYLIPNASGPVAFCCTTPMPLSGRGAAGNITNVPVFVDTNDWSNLRLQSNSACINDGNNAYTALLTDLDGNPRIFGGTVDIGAYEFQSPASVLSYAWAQQNGLPTDGSADFTDADGDGANNWQEWRADTLPTNAASALLMGTATNGVSGLVVSWASTNTRSYWLERASDLSAAPSFQTIATNLAGIAGTQTFTDTSATNGGPYFYRVGVE
jgi:hypothetical protein